MTVARFARQMWTLVEPVHAVVYFAPEIRAALSDVGVDRASSYFAARAAPMGAVGAETAASVFYGFAPRRAAAVLPAVWEQATPAQVVAARRDGVRAALTRLLADVDERVVQRAADLACVAAEAARDAAGRPLAAANHAVLVDCSTPIDRVWQALTVLREHRGEGHHIALAHSEVGPVQAHLIRAALGIADLAFLQRSRDWTDDEVAAARTDLQRRDLLDHAGEPTAAGRALQTEYETATDRLAVAPWRHLGIAGTIELARVLRPLAYRVVEGCADAMSVGLGSPWPPLA